MIFGMAGFVGTVHANAGTIHERAAVFTNTAASAAISIDIRPLDGPLFPVMAHNLDVDRKNCLVANWAMLFADHALTPVSIRDAAIDIE